MTGLQQLTSKGTGKLFFKRFRCETRLQRLTNDLQEVTFEDPDHASFESTNLCKDLHDGSIQLGGISTICPSGIFGHGGIRTC